MKKKLLAFLLIIFPVSSCVTTFKSEPLSPVILTGEMEHINAIAFSKDGKLLASAGQSEAQDLNRWGTIEIWDTQTWELIETLQLTQTWQLSATHIENSKELLWIDFLPSKEPIIVTGDVWGGVYLWNIGKNSIKILRDPSMKKPRIPSAIALSLDGKIFDFTTENIKAPLCSNNKCYYYRYSKSLDFSPDGKLFAVTRVDQDSHNEIVDIWNLEREEIIKSIEIPHTYNIKFFLTPEILAISGKDGLIELWNIQTGIVQQVFSYRKDIGVRELAFSPDGKVIATGSTWSVVYWWLLAFAVKGEIVLWDVSSGQRLYTIRDLVSTYHIIESLVFSPNGNLLATTEDTTIKIWDVQEYLK